MDLSLSIFTGDAARGLERGLSQARITKNHLAFEGKISRLSEDSVVAGISGSALGDQKHYSVRLKEILTHEEMLALTAKYGFSKPAQVAEGLQGTPQGNEHYALLLFIESGHATQRIFFYNPNHKK